MVEGVLHPLDDEFQRAVEILHYVRGSQVEDPIAALD
jgi:hypothetical protein